MERIGFGVHGQVIVVHGVSPFPTVLKVFEAEDPYSREKAVCEVLRALESHGVIQTDVRPTNIEV